MRYLCGFTNCWVNWDRVVRTGGSQSGSKRSGATQATTAAHGLRRLMATLTAWPSCAACLIRAYIGPRSSRHGQPAGNALKQAMIAAARSRGFTPGRRQTQPMQSPCCSGPVETGGVWHEFIPRGYGGQRRIPIRSKRDGWPGTRLWPLPRRPPAETGLEAHWSASLARKLVWQAPCAEVRAMADWEPRAHGWDRLDLAADGHALRCHRAPAGAMSSACLK